MSDRGSFGGDRIIFTLTSEGERRNKHWCEHYRNSDNFCSFMCGKCIGSAFCPCYKSKIRGDVYRVKETPFAEGERAVGNEPKSDGEKKECKRTTVTEYYKRAHFSDKLKGKTVLIKSSPSCFRIGEVADESFRILKVEYDGSVHIYDRYRAITKGGVYVFEGTEKTEEK